MDKTVVWSDGKLVPDGRVLIGATDRGLTGGLGVYESLAVLDGAVFAITRHLSRLAHSATILGIALPDDSVLREAINDVSAEGGWEYGRLRVTATAGASDGEPGVVVVTGMSAHTVEQIRAVRVPWVRNDRSPVVGAKVTSTADNLLAARAAHEAGADEAVLANTRGDLCECTTSNVLVESDGGLVTPPLDSGCLGGVTRQLLLEWSRDWDIPIKEETMPYAILDEVTQMRRAMAVSSTIRTLVPVISLDGRQTRSTDLINQARDLFEIRRRDEIDP